MSLEPELLLCDEPTGNLDSENSQKVVTLLKKLAENYGSTLIVVTHDLSIADQFDNRIVMRDGVVESVKQGVEKIPNNISKSNRDKDEDVKTVTQVEQVELVRPKLPTKSSIEDNKAESDNLADSMPVKKASSQINSRPDNSYVGLNPSEAKSTEELLKKTRELLDETQKILSDDD